MNNLNALIFILVVVLLSACDNAVELPKPRAYPRVIYPEKNYTTFSPDYCNFTFQMPQYAKVERDTTFFETRPDSDCWFNLDVPALNAKIYCSYYPVTSRARFDELVEDAFSLTQKHNVKASYIDEYQVNRPDARVYGLIFNVEGPAASSYQFFLTDSIRHFMRGALYFNTQARPDSLAPVVKFMQQDVDKIVETLQWKVTAPVTK